MAATGHGSAYKSAKTRQSPSLTKKPRCSFPSALDASDSEMEADDELTGSWSTILTAALRGQEASDGDNRLSLSPTQDHRKSKKRRSSGVDGAGAVGLTLGDEKAERTALEVTSRKLELEVAHWKHRHALRSETLQLKGEEIRCKESLTQQQHLVQAMEVRARIIQALGRAGKTGTEVREYLELLED